MSHPNEPATADGPEVVLRDLCIDATVGSAEAVATFWGRLLGQVVHLHDDGDAHLEAPPGTPGSRRVWINQVPEPQVGKARVHIDVRRAEGIDDVVAAGASIVRAPDDEIGWHVLRAPDGLELCVMGRHPRDPDAPDGPFELNVDSTDAANLARWWAARVGGEVRDHPSGAYSWIAGIDGFPYMFWVFGDVAEPKTVKNRMHWDVNLARVTVDDLVAAGARVLREPDDEIRWWVLADPEGNEFCAFAAE